jgi:hypothetical protein
MQYVALVRLHSGATVVLGHRKQIVGDFDGGDICSDGGLMLVTEADKVLGLTRELSAVLWDQRQAGKVRHSLGDKLMPAANTEYWHSNGLQ